MSRPRQLPASMTLAGVSRRAFEIGPVVQARDPEHEADQEKNRSTVTETTCVAKPSVGVNASTEVSRMTP